MRFIYIFLLFTSLLFGSLKDKSAIVYYGSNISYPMVGIHDYIIIQPDLTNVYTHGFKTYKDKIYAYVSIGEIHPHIKEYKLIKPSWVLSENKAWKSKVLDIKNREYQEFIFKKMIEPLLKKGFKNFFFDTLDSYQLVSKTKKQREENRVALVKFINEFHKRYPDSKLIINRGFELIDDIHNSIEAVLFESYYKGLRGVNLEYSDVSDNDRAWLDIYIDKIKSYGIDVISLDYLDLKDINSKAPQVIEKLKQRGLIPVVSNRELNSYGLSSKNPVKREILILIDENVIDKMYQTAHLYTSTIFEYMGYISDIKNIQQELPKIETINKYAGVIIWLKRDYNNPKKLYRWIEQVKQLGKKIVFMNNFAGLENSKYLKKLGIKYKQIDRKRGSILYKDKMVGFEVDAPTSMLSDKIKVKDVKKNILVYKLGKKKKTTLSAITSWGGFCYENGCLTEIDQDNLWIVDPFKFFTQALDLKELIVPDPTTENGKRLMFSHIDGDGIMNRVEASKNKLSGDVILNEILKKYKIPHSVSVIGAEIDKNGLYPKLSNRLQKIAKDMFNLPNVEGATHTFTHPFFWAKIKNDNLDPKYRLKVKNYKFSIENETKGSLDFINKHLIKKGHKKANTVFWSGDCAPRVNALEYLYKNSILNINGGDTTITNNNPWLSFIAPFGIKRGEFYQIYTGAQNENIYTNEWLGPFWGFKKVVQTFKLTDKPRRFKPIDIYYHLYSGSKMASLRALKYVFDWALKQDVMPIFTSEYIPKVMDVYDVSMANEENRWLITGFKDLKTVRIEKKDAGVDVDRSKVLGIKHFLNHTYISLADKDSYILYLDNEKYKDQNYLISSNAKVTKYKQSNKSKTFYFDGYVALNIEFHIVDGCQVFAYPKYFKYKKDKNIVTLDYKKSKKAKIEIKCK